MQSRICFVLSLAMAIVAGGMAIGQTDYRCIESPWPACMTQCGCPTSQPKDFCSGNLPYVGTNIVSRFYCLPWAGSSCIPNGNNCGNKVWVCNNCDCQDCNVICDGHCSETAKPDFCTQNFGCQ